MARKEPTQVISIVLEAEFSGGSGLTKSIDALKAEAIKEGWHVTINKMDRS